MKTNNTGRTTSSGGIGVLGVLQIVFVVLKLTGLITWSWATVLIPTFISLGIIIILLAFIFVAIIISIVQDYSSP